MKIIKRRGIFALASVVVLSVACCSTMQAAELEYLLDASAITDYEQQPAYKPDCILDWGFEMSKQWEKQFEQGSHEVYGFSLAFQR